MSEDFWDNRFHWCALVGGFLAAAEGRLDDSRYVRELVYGLYEGGAFREANSRTPGILAQLRRIQEVPRTALANGLEDASGRSSPTDESSAP